MCLSANDAILTIVSNSSAELISDLDLDQSGAFRLVFGLSQKAQLGLSQKVKSPRDSVWHYSNILILWR